MDTLPHLGGTETDCGEICSSRTLISCNGSLCEEGPGRTKSKKKNIFSI